MLLFLACTGEPAPVDTSDSAVPQGDDPVDHTVPIVLSSMPCDACGGDCLIEELDYDERFHTEEPIEYADRPPAGGPHHPCWATWGMHTEPVEDDHWVHNLEHGGVAFLYACDDCAEDAEAMGNLAAVLESLTFVTPYADMEPRFAAVSWGWRMLTGCYDADAFQAFYVAHVDQGPESTMAEPGEECM